MKLSNRQAKRIALAAQGFATAPPSGRVDRRHFRRVLDQLATVQLDSVNVLTRSHELIFFARLGTYDRTALTRWLWSSQEVFEYWGHEASLHPVTRHPLLRWRMAEGHRWNGIRTAAADHPDLVERTRDAVRSHGPIGIGDLRRATGDQTRQSEWWGWAPTKKVIEHLFSTGDVTATRRAGFDRTYLLPEQWLPEQVLAAPTPDTPEAQKDLLVLSARSAGVGTAKDLADYFRLPLRPTRTLLDDLAKEGRLLHVDVEGWEQPAYLHPEARQPRRALNARALLSPFDSLIWERQRTERIWGFRYRIEIYVPEAKRVHGYYVLPFLLGEDLVARVDLKSDRTARVLRVRGTWAEDAPGQPDRHVVAQALATTLHDMAGWLDLDRGVQVDDRGDLARQLRRAVS